MQNIKKIGPGTINKRGGRLRKIRATNSITTLYVKINFVPEIDKIFQKYLAKMAYLFKKS